MNGPQDMPRRRPLFSKKRNRRSKTRNETQLNGTGREQTGKSQPVAVGKQKKERRGEILVKESELKDLPVPAPLQLKALSNLLNSILIKHGMSAQDIAIRRTIVEDVKQLLQKEIPDCLVRSYGSSYSCLGLKTSDVNIDVHDDNEEKIPGIFIIVLNLLNNDKRYSDVKEEFDTKWPTIYFTEIKSGLKCKVNTGNDTACFTNYLLKIYDELDSRVKPLCVSLKLWAKICKVDCQATGTLPSYSFLLMVVHFLQQTNPPVLPVIHEKLGDEDLTKYFEKPNFSEKILAKIRSNWTTTNTDCLGTLWLGLLRYYSDETKLENIIINVRQEKSILRSSRDRWGKKRYAIEDPFSNKRNVARTLSKLSAFRFIIEHLKLALLYYGRYPGLVSTSDTQPVRNGTETTQCSSVEKITNKRESLGGKPRAPPAVKEAEDKGGYDGENGVLSESDDDDEEEEEEEKEEEDGEERDKNEDDLVDGIFAMDTINDSILSDLEASDVDNDGDVTVTDQSLVSETSFSENIVGAISSQSNIGPVICENTCTPEDIDKGTLALSEQPDFDWRSTRYGFDESVLRRGPGLASKCGSCGEEGHIVENCRVEKKSVLKSLPPITDWFKEMLNRVCYCCRDDYGMSKEQVTERQLYMRALEAYIRSHCPDASLHLFGSSCNGFGFRNSDMDICMMLDGKQKGDVDCISMITFLAKILRNNPQCADVIAITGAKVPIVKFVLRSQRLEADISLYNEVALWNTKLLASYISIDPRVHVLGCTLKIFVKLCEIGDASRGSLSSYAYILMLLHFLQQREPPVIPVLQELYDTEEQPQHMVEGFNCWFFDNLQKLGSKWKPQNRESCGELWLGFLRYYTETFDYHRSVVCVRFRKVLTKFEKMWNGKLICIEDPFVLSHNLGAGLSDGMAKFIRSTFERARERFGTPRRDIPEDNHQRQRFFFDTMFLNNGFLPPTGRNCSICGKIGHWAKECPYNKKNREQGEKKQLKKPQKTKENKVEQKKDEENNKMVERSQSKSKSDKSTASSNSNSSKTSSSSDISENQNNVTAQNMIPSSPRLQHSNQPQLPVPVLKANSPPPNHMPSSPPLIVRPQMQLPHGQPTVPLPHGQPTVPLPHGQPTVPLPHGQPTVTLPHGQPTVPLPHGQPTVPLAHGQPTAPLPHGQPTVPLPHGQPTAPLPHGQPTVPLPHGQPMAPLPHGQPMVPLPHGQPTAPLPHGQPTVPLPHGQPTVPLPRGRPTVPLPHGQPTAPLPHGQPTAPLPHGQPTAPFSQRPSTAPLPHRTPAAPLRYRLPTAPPHSLPLFPGSPPTALFPQRPPNYMPSSPPLIVRPQMQLPHGQPTVPLPHGQPTVPLPHGQPMALLPHGQPMAPLLHGQPTVPLPHGQPTVPLPRGQPTVPLPRGQPMAPLPHGQPMAPFSQRPSTAPLLHRPPTAPLLHWTPTAPLRYRLPTAPPHNLPPAPFPGSSPTASFPRPLGSPTSPVLRPCQSNHMIYPNTVRPLAPCFSQAPPLQAQIRPQIRTPGRPPNFEQRASVVTNFHPNAVAPHHENTLMNSPPLPQQFAPYVSPQQHLVSESPQMAKPSHGRYSPLVPDRTLMTANDFPKQTPHHGVISCEDLENEDNRTLAVDGDQVDGAKEKLGDHPVSPNATVRPANDGFSPSVIQSLRSMNISGIAIVDERIHGAGERQGNRQATSGETPVAEVQGTFKGKRGGKETSDRFSTPPNVQHVPDKSLTFNELASLVKENSPGGNVMTKASNNAQNLETRTEATRTRNEKQDVDSLKKNKKDVKHVTVQQNQATAVRISNTEIEQTREPSTENLRNRRRRSNRRRNKQVKESQMNETRDEQTVKPKNTRPARHVRQYNENQEVDKEHPAKHQGRDLRYEARTPNQKFEKSSSISDKGGQGKDDKVKEKKNYIAPHANTLDKAPKQQNSKTSLKTAGMIVVKVDCGDDKRTVVVDGGKSSDDIVNHGPSKRGRRRPPRGRKSTTHTEDNVRRDQGSRKTGEKNAKTEVKK